MKAIAVVAMYHGREEMERYVEECVRITQVRDGGCALLYTFYVSRLLYAGCDSIYSIDQLSFLHSAGPDSSRKRLTVSSI